MQIECLKFKNIASYGNRLQTIDLGNPSFYQVVGGVGHGKSTISDVLKFVLYGTLGKDGRKLKDLPNRINGAAWAYIKFKARNHVVEVERGIDPNILNITVDGTPYDRANKRAPNEYLTEELIEIPFHVFNNIISLSINDFKSFLKMGAEDKRKIIDKVFGFTIINQMREILKTEIKRVSDSIDSINVRISSAQRSLNSSIQELELLTKKIQDNTDDRVKTLKGDLDKYRLLLDFHQTKLVEFNTEESSFRVMMSELTALVGAARSAIGERERKLTLYVNAKCPTCSSDLTSDFHTGMKLDLEGALAVSKSDYTKANTDLESARQKQIEFDEKKRVIYDKGSKIKQNIDLLAVNITQLERGAVGEHQISSIQNIVDKMQLELTDSNVERSKIDEKLNWVKVLENVLSDRGVKQLAVRTILPSLNSEIFRLMEEMHLDYKVLFNEEFDATISHFGTEIGVSTLSTGEMKKVDFVVLVAIIKLMKMRFPGINLLFLDEIFSSIDADGIHSILKILSAICKDMGMNIFVISHNPLPAEIFDYRISIERNNGFSNLTIEQV